MERGKSWNAKEMSLIKDTNKSLEDLHQLLPHRTINSIRLKATRLGFQRTGEALFRSSRNYRELLHDNEFCQVVDGELLGDGCIIREQRRGKSYYGFSYSTSNREYAKYLHAYLTNKTNSSGKLYYPDKSKPHYIDGRLVKSSQGYLIKISHRVFEYFYKQWYVPKKIIPSKLVLTPLVCKHWYIGDGSLLSKKSSPVITISTHSFSIVGVDGLISRLSCLGIEAHRNKYKKDQYVIRIIGRNAVEFLNFIGSCPVKSYQYKWNIGDYRQFHKTCHCGKSFSYFGRSETWRKHCNDKCRIDYKRQKAKCKHGFIN